MEHYDIFISYRRDGGFETAKHLNDLLVHDGYRVSFDIDTLRSGNFDAQLLERIDQCKDFIVVVDQHAFDRTLDPNFNPKNDWMRCELAYALKKNKNIIPVFLSGVTGFPANLPEDLAGVIKKNGPEYNRYYFNDFYKTLKTRFLHKKRNNVAIISFIIIPLILLIMFFGINSTCNKTQLSEQEKAMFYADKDSINPYGPNGAISSDNIKSTDDVYGVPPAPKFTKAKITVEQPDYFYESGSACEMADRPYVGYVISSEETDDNTITVTMQDAETRVRSYFYINKDRMCNADLSWLPYVLIEGNKVRVEYFYEGQGGFQQVLTMENLQR